MKTRLKTTSISLSIPLLAALPLALASCNKFEVAHRVEGPIHMVVDVNLRVDRQLEEFFEFEEDLPTTRPTIAGAATQPATRPAATTTTTTTATSARQ